jgi:hypothetical protein
VTALAGRAAASVALAAALAMGCTGGDDDSDVARGRGLVPAALPPAEEARAFQAAVGAAFDPGPDLSLLLHPRRLPRAAGTAGGEPVPAAVAAALRERRVVRGACEPPDDVREPPTCTAELPGYVVRGSDVFRVAADTVQLHLAAERYRTAQGDPQEALRFEKAFKLARGEGGWRVVGEARVP